MDLHGHIYHGTDIAHLLLGGVPTARSVRMKYDRPLYTLVIQAIISILFICGYGMVLYVVLQPGAEFSPSAEKLATFVLGALTTALVSISAYWFRDDTDGSNGNGGNGA